MAFTAKVTTALAVEVWVPGNGIGREVPIAGRKGIESASKRIASSLPKNPDQARSVRPWSRAQVEYEFVTMRCSSGGRNECPSSKHLCDRGDEIGSHPHFRYTRVTSCCEASGDLINIHKHTKEDYLRFAAMGPETPRDIDPIQIRHRKIQNENIWNELVCRFNRRLSVCDAPDHIKVVVEEANHTRAHGWMIFGNQQFRFHVVCDVNSPFPADNSADHRAKFTLPQTPVCPVSGWAPPTR